MSRVSAAASVKLTAKHLHSVVIEDSTFQVIFWKLSKTEDYEVIKKRILMTKMMTRRPGSSLAWYFLLQHHISIGHKVLMTIPRYYISSFEEEHIVYNTRNRFEHPTPRSISITEGRRVEVSYNLLDVSEVLKVEFYS